MIPTTLINGQMEQCGQIKYLNTIYPNVYSSNTFYLQFLQSQLNPLCWLKMLGNLLSLRCMNVNIR